MTKNGHLGKVDIWFLTIPHWFIRISKNSTCFRNPFTKFMAGSQFFVKKNLWEKVMIGRMLKWSFSNSLDLFGRPKNPFNPGIFRRPCTWMGASHTSSPIDLSVTHRYERTHQATLSILTPICRGSATHSALTTTYIVCTSTYLPCTQAKA